ncbi:hypothetical protein BGZ75_008144 [Mortierella antarctica]|nr:hypothetical protein BGZ75_008144 [Mortierella antarctica]
MDPRKLKVNELKEQLQLAGLSANGKKEELVARLLEHQQKAEEAALEAEGPPTGAGDTFDWEDSKFDVDDLAPPADPTPKAAEKKGSSDTTAPASTTEAGAVNPSTTTTTATSAKSTAAATTATAAAAAASGSLKDVQFQGAVKDAETLKAEFEKRKNRAARFGIPLKEQDKAVERAARFGVPVTPAATASLAKATTLPAKPTATTATAATAATTPASVKPVPAKPGSVVAQIPADVLNKRRERFGIQAPTTLTPPSTTSSAPVLDAAEEEKKRKRAAKFGTAPSSEEITKKMKA